METTPSPSAQNSPVVDTVVAGAGLTGLTTAVLLARSGQRTAVLEARHIGAAATGNTTAKVSLLQGTKFSAIAAKQSREVLQAYVSGNREGQQWLLRYLEDNGLDYQVRTAYSYAHSHPGLEPLQQELEACLSAGVPARWTESTELPFPTAGVLALDDQAQIHPTLLLQALLDELMERGGAVHTGVRVVDASGSAPLTVQTTAGTVQADHLVLATGVPVLDRGGYFAKLTGERSYASAYRLPAGRAPPQGMYLSVDSPGRSTRTAEVNGEELLLVGGNGHMVGRAESHRGAVEDLHTWTVQHFPGAQLTHRWSAQDYQPADSVPFVGPLPRRGGRIHVATGYSKWGMTNAVAAALALSSQILGGSMPWAETLSSRRPTVSAVLSGVQKNVSIGARMGTDWASAELQSLPEQVPPEGSGVVGRSGGRPVGISTLGGAVRQVSAICPHMGGVLNWNDAECTWDCPLHASRFTADGTLLEGPAVNNLTRLDDDGPGSSNSAPSG